MPYKLKNTSMTFDWRGPQKWLLATFTLTLVFKDNMDVAFQDYVCLGS
jgi:hypothetical protein